MSSAKSRKSQDDLFIEDEPLDTTPEEDMVNEDEPADDPFADDEFYDSEESYDYDYDVDEDDEEWSDEEAADIDREADVAPVGPYTPFWKRIGTPRERGMGARVAWIALLVVVFFVPLATMNFEFFGSYQQFSYDMYGLVKLVVLAIGVIVMLGGWVYELIARGVKLKHTPLNWLVAAFVLWAVVTTFTSVQPATAIFGNYQTNDGLIAIICYALIFFLGLQLIDGPKQVKAIAQALFFSSIIVNLYALSQAFRIRMDLPYFTFEAGRTYSTYGNPNLLAGFLAFAIFVALGLALSEKKTSWKIFYWVGAALAVGIAITTSSQSLWAGMLVGAVLLIVFAVLERISWSNTDTIFTGVSLLAGVGFVLKSVGSSSAITNFVKRIAHIGNSQIRFDVWDAALKAIGKRPIQGYGSDTFSYVFPRFRTDSLTKLAGYQYSPPDTFSYPLHLAVGMGIPGAVLFYVIFIWGLVKAFGACAARVAKGAANRMVFAGFFCAVVAFLVYSSVSLVSAGTLFLLWVGLAVLLAPTARIIEVRRPSQTASALLFISTLLVCIAAAGLQVSTFISDHYYAQSLINANDPNVAAADAQKAAEFAPWDPKVKSALATTEIVQAYDTLNTTGATKTALKQVEQAKTYLDDAIAADPWNYDNYAYKAQFYNALGQGFNNTQYLTEARMMEEEQIKNFPNETLLRYEYANTLQLQGNKASAKKTLENVIKSAPGYKDAKTLLDSMDSTDASATAK